MPDQVVVRTFSYRHEAEVARSFLEGHGIEASVTSDDCGSVDPALGLVRGVHLLVDEAQSDQARRLLESGHQ